MRLTDLNATVPFGLAGLACRQARFLPAASGAVWQVQEPGAAALLLRRPAALDAAVPQRQAEFMAGRLCAALALRQLRAPSLDVPVNPDRSPRWPQGFAGSISHCGDRVLALAARSADYNRLGVDLETVMPEAQARDLAGSLLAPGDAALRPPELGFAAFVTLVFSAKEAFYKALSADLGRIIGFHEVRLCRIGPRALWLQPVPEAGAGSRPYRLHYQLVGNQCLTLLAEPCGG